MRKIYYYLELENTSPIHVGSGDDTNSDLDVILDKNGMFYIPGTSMVGSILHYLSEEDRKIILPEMEVTEATGEKKNQTKQSPVFFSDAVLIEKDKKPAERMVVEKRDGIKLDENKITIKNNKYDYEIVPKGKRFQWRIEICDRNKKCENDESHSLEAIMEKVIEAIDSENIKVGYKTTRGLGNLKVCKCGKRVFDKDNIQEFLKFDQFDGTQYEEKEIDHTHKNSERYTTLRVLLSQRGGLSIRTYNTEKGLEDYEHIHSAGVPVIPGTSWNGLIRHNFSKYIQELKLPLDINHIFGMAGDVDKEKIKSKVYIYESVIGNSVQITQTRIRVNPFTGGTVNSALYKEKSCYNGKTELKIMIDKEIENEEHENCIDLLLDLFRIFINDLNYGFIALGGETSIGRGLFHVEEVYVDGDIKDWVVQTEC